MKEITLPEPFFFERGKRAVLLLHAYTGSANDMRLLGRFLERNNYTVYAPQFTGHATDRFEDILEKGDPEIWREDALSAADFLFQKGYEQVAVFGLSMGGVVATNILPTGQFIGGGSFNSPIMEVGKSNVPKAFLNFARYFKKQRGIPAQQISEEVEAMVPHLEAQRKKISQFSRETRELLPQIKVPYYLASAGRDELIDPASGAALRDALTGTKVDYQYFPEATHVITVGKNRDAFEETLLTFLENLSWKEG